MANQRGILRRIKSITNTKKITSTMEMVSTAKMKKLQGQLEQAKPYEQSINEIITNLLASGIEESFSPLIQPVSHPSRILLLTITGNRGLCGSFNTNVISKSLAFKAAKVAEGMEVFHYMVGKKGTGFFNFTKEPMMRHAINKDDKLTFDDAAAMGIELRDLFLGGDVHEVYISYTKVITATSQKPEIVKLLPIAVDVDEIKGNISGTRQDYIFKPTPVEILNYILPLYMKVKVFSCFLESSFSESFARRVAMKNASDASTDMIRELTITYNRARQAKITKEIAEIVGGAAALE